MATRTDGTRLFGAIVVAGMTAGASFAGACGGQIAHEGDATSDASPPDGFDVDARGHIADGPGEPRDAYGERAIIDAPAEAPPSGSHGKAIFVHASPNLFAANGELGGVRICFATSTGGGTPTVAPLAPLPDDDTKVTPGGAYPGIFPGRGAVQPDLIDLTKIAITLFAVSALKLRNDVRSNPNEHTCDQLLGPTGSGGLLTLGVHYFNLGSIPAGTFVHGSTTLVAFTGCVMGETDPTVQAKCGGPSYNPTTGNLGVLAIALDRTTIPNPTGIAWGFANLSTPWDAVAFSLATAQGGSYAGSAGQLVDMDSGGGIAPPSAPEDSGHLSATGQALSIGPSTGFAVTARDANGNPVPLPSGGSLHVAMSLADIFGFTTGGGPLDGGTGYPNGTSFTFVLVGDPSQPLTTNGGAFNNYAAHLLAFPNDPPLPGP